MTDTRHLPGTVVPKTEPVAGEPEPIPTHEVKFLTRRRVRLEIEGTWHLETLVKITENSTWVTVVRDD